MLWQPLDFHSFRLPVILRAPNCLCPVTSCCGPPGTALVLLSKPTLIQRQVRQYGQLSMSAVSKSTLSPVQIENIQKKKITESSPNQNSNLPYPEYYTESLSMTQYVGTPYCGLLPLHRPLVSLQHTSGKYGILCML